MDVETRIRRLEWMNRILALSVICLVLFGFSRNLVAAKGRADKLIRAERLEIVDEEGEATVILGRDKEGAAGLFINDPAGAMRIALAHDAAGSALFIRDAEGVIRIGVAQFSHGGGGVALHGPQSQGAAVLYFKEKGTLTFYDPQGEHILQIPEQGSP